MRATLEWATLLVCCAALLLRVPDAVRGRNRTVFGILFLGTLCSVLAVSELYELIDRALGGWDLTSLILRYLVFATVLLVGLRVTRGLAADRAHQLIAGGIGRWALGLGCLAVTLAFFLMDSYGSPEGLHAQAADGAGDADLAPWFTAAGRTYPAFVSLVLVAPLLAAVRSRLPRLVRAGALLVLLGAAFAVLSLPAALTPSSWAGAQHFVNYAAALGYVVGLVVFWFSGLIASPSGNARATLRRNRG
ncbi:hypothetical protein J2W14_002840 [Pseudarthrobacter oxydans]|uniref:hypothetical protein n=1 Tax=Pseudarthrobacter oxydans TaxID=1671 RepID=UPI00278990D3|nr:hypothetical protein [Pseudarthrobacter oxydans]MDP9983419.1 hypothetical protein [Pseudarthrobacter oxydans]